MKIVNTATHINRTRKDKRKNVVVWATLKVKVINVKTNENITYVTFNELT